MSRTFIRQNDQIAKSDLFDASLDLSTAESAPLTIEDDLNFIRTALKNAKGTATWYTAVSDSFNLQSIHDKKFIFWIQKTDDVSVPAGQNYVALTLTAKPSEVIAFGGSSLGAITGQLPGSIGSHSTITANNNGNLVEVRDSTSNDIIETAAGHQIYGLLQVGSAATDGNAFADSGDDQAQLSFVYINPVNDTITACAVSDIEGKTVEYAFRKRTDFFNLPENALDPTVTFTESFSTNQITLQLVYNNSSNGQIDLASAKNFTVNLNSNSNFEIKDGVTSYFKTDRSGTKNIFSQNVDISTGKALSFYDADNSNFVGLTAPALTANVNLVLPDSAGNSNDVISSNGSGALSFRYVGTLLNTKKAVYDTTPAISANTNISLSSFSNPNSMSFGAVAATWTNDFEVYLNGSLMTLGVNQAAGNDFYYVSSTQLASIRNIKADSIIQIVQRR